MARSVCAARADEIFKEEKVRHYHSAENSDSSHNQNNAMQRFENSGQANYRSVVTGR
jgi:hypothetical protein